WFIFAIVLSLSIVTVLAVVDLTLAGVNVMGWAKEKGSNVPVVSSFVKSEEETDLQIQLDQAKETIEQQKEEIKTLDLEIDSLEAIIDQQEQDITKLEKKTISDEQLNNPLNEDSGSDSLKQTAASFRKMDQEKAAEILKNLDRQIAVDILQQLSNDVRGKILEEMEPALAAELTQRLIDG